jgi:hydrogenase maturation protein HypF
MERRAIHIRGIVQGVGFRPFVHNLATRLGLSGFVKNQTGTVFIEAEGNPQALDRFLAELKGSPPPLAQIAHLSIESREPRGEQQFRIEVSDAETAAPIFVSPDIATCPDCRKELLDPTNRRFGYPFLNCTNCGPRLTIITGAPYDRPRTTMASFSMCAACQAEYDNPPDRRFHAQPTACSACGPRVRLLDASGKPLESANPLTAFAAEIQEGRIGALKGLGGYHLVCDARNPAAVAELRRRKHRDEKPFAIMVADIDAARKFCQISALEQQLLESAARPIVLLCKTLDSNASTIAVEVSPCNPCLGVMLPYTPLHYLLCTAVDRSPLVMTSGNQSDEPIAYHDDDAVQRLAGIADLFLVHDRPIHVRCDDSVTRVVDGLELPMRRSRGYAPRSIEIPIECPCPVLAVGGQLKATFALGRDRQAFLSQHMGDLDYYDAYRAFVRDIGLFEELFALSPQCLVHDLHPDYASTRYCLERGTRLLGVQHHHAHMASCMAENGVTEPVIGISFDGSGYGTDHAVWGGEFLIGDYKSYRRDAHFRYVGMPGGDRAIREPWRMAVAHLHDVGLKHPAWGARLLHQELETITMMLERRFRTPPTSSVGRLFDAVASLAGVRDRVSYEGQAAVELEWLASEVAPKGLYPYAMEQDPRSGNAPLVIDTRPLIAAVHHDAARSVDAAVMGRRFHSTLVDIVAQVCCKLRDMTGLTAVALSGGVFLNALLTTECSERLKKEGFRVFRHRLVPPNDGGLSLGQVAIAAATLAKS